MNEKTETIIKKIEKQLSENNNELNKLLNAERKQQDTVIIDTLLINSEYDRKRLYELRNKIIESIILIDKWKLQGVIQE